MKKFILTISFILVSLGTLSLPVYAYGIPDEYAPINAPFTDSSAYTKDPSSLTVSILQMLAGSLLYFAAPIAVLMLVLAAMKFVTAGDDTEKVGEAKKHLTWVIGGLLIIILSYSIVRAVIESAIKVGDMSSSAPTAAETSGGTNGTGGTGDTAGPLDQPSPAGP